MPGRHRTVFGHATVAAEPHRAKRLAIAGAGPGSALAALAADNVGVHDDTVALSGFRFVSAGGVDFAGELVARCQRVDDRGDQPGTQPDVVHAKPRPGDSDEHLVVSDWWNGPFDKSIYARRRRVKGFQSVSAVANRSLQLCGVPRV